MSDFLYRCSYIGSTDVSAILNANPFKSIYDVWCEKKNKVQSTFLDDQLERMKWGLLLEDIVLKEACERMSLVLDKTQVHTTHDKYDFLRGTADGITKENFLLESKTSGEFNKSYDDEIPPYYYIQANYLMGLNKVLGCIFPVLFGGNRLKIYTLEFDKEFYELCIDSCVKFWNKSVLGNEVIPTPIDKIKVETGTQALIFEDTKESIEILKKLKSDIKTLEKHAEFHENVIKTNFGSAEILVNQSGNKICTYKESSRTSFDDKKLKEFLGENVSSYQKTTNYRTLRI